MLARRIDDRRTLSSTAVRRLRIRFIYAKSPYRRYRYRDCNLHWRTYLCHSVKPCASIDFVASNPSKQCPGGSGSNLPWGACALGGGQHSGWNGRRVRLPWLSATTTDPLVWSGSNCHHSFLRTLRLSPFLSRHSWGSTDCLSRRNLWHRRNTTREPAQRNDRPFSRRRYGWISYVYPPPVTSPIYNYRSTASATEFPPPRQSAATPFFTSRRTIS
jgi:hypothetical protein